MVVLLLEAQEIEMEHQESRVKTLKGGEGVRTKVESLKQTKNNNMITIFFLPFFFLFLFSKK